MARQETISVDQFRQRFKNRSKFGNRRTMVDGIMFDSAKEARRYGVLKLAERCGHIRDLKRQVEYRLEVKGQLICKYMADFEYRQQATHQPGLCRSVVEDVKSPATRRTRAYSIKRKLMLAIHNITIKET